MRSGGWKRTKESINLEGGFFLWRVEFFKLVSVGSMIIKEMRVNEFDEHMQGE